LRHCDRLFTNSRHLPFSIPAACAAVLQFSCSAKAT
jgi:hypothetical protein